MTRRIFNPLRATLALVPLAVAVATLAGPAPLAHASNHTLTLGPAETYSPRSDDHGGPNSYPGCNVDYPPGSLVVGYVHSVSSDFFGDAYGDCVHQAAVRFDLS